MHDDLLIRRDEERELLLRTAEGDRAAFTRLHERLRALVEGWVRQCLVDRWQAEEVVQDVFLEVWRLADRYDPRHPPVSWVRTIAQRRAVDRVRKAEADRRRDVRAGVRYLDTVDHASVERAEGVLDREALRRAIVALPERQREAVVLRHLEELTGPELAERLGVPVGTAKTRARDGVLALRRSLGS
ncbi:sigma-70 family RNA polymerase sigma factor [Curtobacterium sp. MCSS17_008]|uniref:sigma-70 family RNA polymerase sigma factor n=1 Tax=Curtobacterium sp. MCSS17_008 TaxID=2175647 RepID=UPI001C645A04|nr:sigma-70 family RNA polymerase sigma factor [Curtobacterium sp. MCSS17_008]